MYLYGDRLTYTIFQAFQQAHYRIVLIACHYLHQMQHAFYFGLIHFVD